uniref:Uncharacterized protein n=1 Tax=Arundo donax TaxID=35708 RepID=A0A0A8YE78_ARUDO
MADTNAMILT